MKPLPVFLLISLMSLTLACGPHMKGTYSAPYDAMTVEFHGSKALVTIGGTTTEIPYSVEGARILLHGSSGNMVLTREKDGSLAGGPLGTHLVQVSK